MEEREDLEGGRVRREDGSEGMEVGRKEAQRQEGREGGRKEGEGIEKQANREGEAEKLQIKSCLSNKKGYGHQKNHLNYAL